MNNNEWATRLDWVGSAFELGLSYKRGFDKMARVIPLVSRVDFATQTAVVTLHRDFPRVEIYGLDFLVPLGNFIFRAEASAWDYRRNLSFGSRTGGTDKLLYTLELEHSRHDWHTILAWGDVRYRESSPIGGALPTVSGPSLAQGGLPAVLLSVERKTVGEWGVKFTGIFDTARHGWLARGAYSVPLATKLRAEIGADLFGGPGDSFYGLFNDEDRLRVGLVYSF